MRETFWSAVGDSDLLLSVSHSEEGVCRGYTYLVIQDPIGKIYLREPTLIRGCRQSNAGTRQAAVPPHSCGFGGVIPRSRTFVRLCGGGPENSRVSVAGFGIGEVWQPFSGTDSQQAIGESPIMAPTRDTIDFPTLIA